MQASQRREIPDDFSNARKQKTKTEYTQIKQESDFEKEVYRQKHYYENVIKRENAISYNREEKQLMTSLILH